MICKFSDYRGLMGQRICAGQSHALDSAVEQDSHWNADNVMSTTQFVSASEDTNTCNFPNSMI